jgi:hypothetical protein
VSSRTSKKLERRSKARDAAIRVNDQAKGMGRNAL